MIELNGCSHISDSSLPCKAAATAHSTRWLVHLFIFVIVYQPVAGSAAELDAPTGWSGMRNVKMQGDLRVFWNVGGRDRDRNERAAVAHGFELVDLLGTYTDYPGKQREKIVPDGRNPWKKPPFFERIVRRNVSGMRGKSIFVHDIEFGFEEDTTKLWSDPVLRAASRAASPDGFREAYYREWASWYTLPCNWAKERYPNTPIGIYGPQPFRRDYWGVAGKDAQQIDGTHKTDAELWKHIDPAVDFAIASIYCFYDKPGSVYYMGANVEENVQRMRQYGKKPVYAYVWLRYHNSNAKLKNRELDDYLVEAMAVLPYFCGARGIVVWGWEPKGQGHYYRNLPLFMKSLGRVADLSDKISQAKLVAEEPVHVAWKEKRPLIRKLQVSDAEWLVLAVHPWQAENELKKVSVRCGAIKADLTIRGKHSEIFHINNGRVARIEL